MTLRELFSYNAAWERDTSVLLSIDSVPYRMKMSLALQMYGHRKVAFFFDDVISLL